MRNLWEEISDLADFDKVRKPKKVFGDHNFNYSCDFLEYLMNRALIL